MLDRARAGSTTTTLKSVHLLITCSSRCPLILAKHVRSILIDMDLIVECLNMEMVHSIWLGHVLFLDANISLLLGVQVKGPSKHLIVHGALGRELALTELLYIALGNELLLGLDGWARFETLTQGLNMGQRLGYILHHAMAEEKLPVSLIV